MKLLLTAVLLVTFLCVKVNAQGLNPTDNPQNNISGGLQGSSGPLQGSQPQLILGLSDVYSADTSGGNIQVPSSGLQNNQGLSADILEDTPKPNPGGDKTLMWLTIAGIVGLGLAGAAFAHKLSGGSGSNMFTG